MLPSASARSPSAASRRSRHARVRRPRKAIGGGVAAELAQLGEQRRGAAPAQGDGLLVEDRIGEAGIDEHVAEVVHVDVAGRRRRPAFSAVEIAQLAQRAGPEAREHGDAVDLEQRVPAREQRRRVDDEVERHVGPDELGAADLGVARRLVEDDRAGRAERPPRAALRRTPARRPRGVGFDGDALGTRIGGANDIVAAAGAGPPFDDAARLGAHRREPLDQATRDLAMQPGQRVVATQAAERGARRHAIDATRLAGFARRHGAAVY